MDPQPLPPAGVTAGGSCQRGKGREGGEGRPRPPPRGPQSVPGSWENGTSPRRTDRKTRDGGGERRGGGAGATRVAGLPARVRGPDVGGPEGCWRPRLSLSPFPGLSLSVVTSGSSTSEMFNPLSAGGAGGGRGRAGASGASSPLLPSPRGWGLLLYRSLPVSNLPTPPAFPSLVLPPRPGLLCLPLPLGCHRSLSLCPPVLRALRPSLFLSPSLWFPLFPTSSSLSLSPFLSLFVSVSLSHLCPTHLCLSPSLPSPTSHGPSPQPVCSSPSL